MRGYGERETVEGRGERPHAYLLLRKAHEIAHEISHEIADELAQEKSKRDEGEAQE